MAGAALVAATLFVSSFQVFALGPSHENIGIFVDATLGSDANPGTPDRPLRTVNQAAQLAMRNRKNGISTIVTVRPGTYREVVQIAGSGTEMNASITIQASEVGGAIISGSDLWTDWKSDPSNAKIYLHPWQYRWGSCKLPRGWPAIKDLGLRREMIFVNGTPLMQTLSQNELKGGSFFIDEAKGVVSLRPPDGTDMSRAMIEVAVRPGVFKSDGVSNLSLKGLVFQHANSCISSSPHAAVTISGGTNNLVEDTAIRWNNWIGLDYFSATNSTLQRVALNWNGELGINGFRLKNVTFEGVETSHNNWRGAQGQFTTWEPSGGKFLRVHGATFRDYIAIGNQGRGVWFDTDNIDVTIDRATIEQNLMGGIDLEANMGPVTIKNSRICGNQREGIQNNQTDNVTLAGNVIYDNGKAQIVVGDIQKPRTDTNWETKAAFSATSDYWVLSQNTIVGANAKQFVYGTLRLPNQAPSTFLSTMKSDGNIWFNPEVPDAFEVDPGAPDHPAKTLNFTQWQSATGQDARSKFGPPDSSPAKLCAVP